jgi:hypothetical protein
LSKFTVCATATPAASRLDAIVIVVFINDSPCTYPAFVETSSPW